MSRMLFSGPVVWAFVSFAMLLGLSGSVSAQDVKWRTDFAAARKEATETGRALLLDFGTESCFWCKKLDATTFRDPKVVKLLNEQFIPVKIDAQKYQQLTDKLGIESFPTLVLATAEGKVIGRHVGFADVAKLTAFLNKVPAPAPVPVAAVAPMTEADKQRRAKEEIDAGLAAALPRITAALDR